MKTSKSRTARIAALLPIVLIASFAFGCAKYKRKIADQDEELAKLRIEIDELEANRQDLESAQSDLEKANADLEAARAELEARIASMLEYQKALESQLEELGVDKSKMAAKFEAARKSLASQQKLVAEMRKKQAAAQHRLRTLKNMLLRFKSLIQGGKLKVRIRNGKLTLELPSAVLFELGVAALSEDGKKTLAQVASVLARVQNREFQVAGHTDNVPITSGRYPSNWELSTARAVSVVKFLQRKGVRPTALSAAGYSQYQPAVPNTDKPRRKLNRRIEIVLMPNLDELPDLSALERELKK